MDKGKQLPTISLNYLQFAFTSPRPISMPAFPGSAWRGAFGHALRANGCITGEKSCEHCHAAAACPYAYIFETPPRDGGGERGITTQAPRPYVISAPPSKPKSQHRYTLRLTLTGSAAQHLGLIIYAFQEAGRRGVAGNGPMELDAVEVYDGKHWLALNSVTDSVLPSLSEKIPEANGHDQEIRFHTPLRLKNGGRYLSAEAASPLILARALLGRLWELARHHGGEGQPPYPGDLHERLRSSRFVQQRLKWQEVYRHSNRQGKKHPIGGLIGSLRLHEDDARLLWPALWLGQFLHIGKLTTLGHGGYTLVSQACEQGNKA